MKPVVFRQAAKDDIQQAADHYVDEAGVGVASAFADAVAAAVERLSLTPHGGSLRWGEQLGLEGLRSWNVRRFPYVVFYFDGAERTEIWRVLHGQRDLETELSLGDD